MDQIDPGRVKRQDLAEILGVSEETIRQRTVEGTFTSLGAGKYELAATVQAWVKYQAQGKASEAQARARRSVDTERARKLKLENDILERKALPADEVVSAFSQAMIVLRQHVGAIGSRISGKVAGMTDADEIRRTINTETDRALNECETGLQDLAGTEPGDSADPAADAA